MKLFLKSRFVRSALLLLGAGAGAALACGPDFPTSILSERLMILREAPHNSFAFEAQHLAPRAPHKAVDVFWSEDDRSRAKDEAEKKGLSPAQALAIRDMRYSGSGDAAMGLGAGLAPALVLYTAGAADFIVRDYANARKRFAAVLALPPDQARPRLLWAAYSLGRADAALGEMEQAKKDFAKVRELAKPGVPDDLGLAAASLGEEARLHLIAANAQIDAPPPEPPSSPPPPDEPAPDPDMVLGHGHLRPGGAEMYGREMRAAADLYARQAATGSDVGLQSLRILTDNILAEAARLDTVISDPLAQRLVVSYALTRDVFGTFESRYLDEATKAKLVATGDGKLAEPETASLFARVIDALARAHIAAPVNADRLAALAYRMGRFDLARTMADKSRAPMAEWVKAKLALRAGDLAAAQGHYAAAARAIPAGGLEPDNAALLVGEQGAIALARDQYLEALRLLYSSKAYWTDAAYLAERVLTADELKTFVDAQPLPQKPQCVADSWDTQTNIWALRDLLARRLMRDKRHDEALPYFCKEQTRAIARTYIADLRAGESGWDKVGRARRLFHAAQAARNNGMEIMGTEVHPDYSIYGGAFETGSQVDQLNPGDARLITAGERARTKASTPAPNLRFHYRYIAADEAEAAASLLPPRSQAFAAVLCTASGWMLNAPDGYKRGWAIYQRYVREGAYIPFPAKLAPFGRVCPAPDFGGATYLSRTIKAVERRLTRRFAFLRRSH